MRDDVRRQVTRRAYARGSPGCGKVPGGLTPAARLSGSCGMTLMRGGKCVIDSVARSSCPATASRGVRCTEAVGSDVTARTGRFFDARRDARCAMRDAHAARRLAVPNAVSRGWPVTAAVACRVRRTRRVPCQKRRDRASRTRIRPNPAASSLPAHAGRSPPQPSNRASVADRSRAVSGSQSSSHTASEKSRGACRVGTGTSTSLAASAKRSHG